MSRGRHKPKSAGPAKRKTRHRVVPRSERPEAAPDPLHPERGSDHRGHERVNVKTTKTVRAKTPRTRDPGSIKNRETPRGTFRK
jgi:hypothetical protein